MHSAAPSLSTIRIKSHQAHDEAGRFCLLAGQFNNFKARDTFTRIANAIQKMWTNGWRRSNGTLANEFVIYMWTSTNRITGKLEFVVRMGFDLAIPTGFTETPERELAVAA